MKEKRDLPDWVWHLVWIVLVAILGTFADKDLAQLDTLLKAYLGR